jgi:protein-tyrosine phosphatase
VFDRVLVLCTGNICRSPYAAAKLQAAFPAKTVVSAGLGALEGEGADPQGLALAKERGLDLSAHVAQQVDRRLVNSSDLIMVMDDGHLKRLFAKYPEARGKTFKLARWLGDKSIGDPYQKSNEFFSIVFDEIDKAVDSWKGKL